MDISQLFTFSTIAGILFPALFTLIGLGFLFTALRVWLKTLAARGWQSTSGIISTSAIEEAEDDGTMYYHPQIAFQYEVGGKNYTSKQYALGSNLTWGGQGRNRSDAEQFIQRYPLGRQVQVYYNPRQPKDAVLEVRAANTLPIFALSLVFFILAAAFVAGIAWLSSQ